MQKIFIISGEASGDLHGSNLVKELLLLQPKLQLQGWGGNLMQQHGVEILKHYNQLAFMGFAEVIKNLGTIMKNFSLCKSQIEAFQPDAIIFIDYPGFNLRMAKWAKEKGYKTIYYISPQIWAWKENRIHTIKKYVDQMLVILPFEKEFYNKWNYKVTYVGHPLIKVIEDFKDKNNSAAISNNTIALLPGSRQQEISVKLPIMLKMANLFPQYKFVVAIAPGMENNFYTPFLQNYSNVQVKEGSTYELLSNAAAAIVTSGTATLETALFQVPQVVCYKGSKLSYLIAKRLLKIKYISLVNLISNKLVVQELIQDAFNETNLEKELHLILNKENREVIQKDYTILKEKLTIGGDASKNAAELILEKN